MVSYGAKRRMNSLRFEPRTYMVASSHGDQYHFAPTKYIQIN
jgi:hypothetical protein